MRLTSKRESEIRLNIECETDHGLLEFYGVKELLNEIDRLREDLCIALDTGYELANVIDPRSRFRKK